jgi:uncharacterized protein (TIGR03435 family)
MILIGVLVMNTCLASAIALSTISAFAAQNAPDQPKFEVASVKRAERCEFKTSIDPGSVTLKGLPLKAVLMEAFKVKMDDIEGPSWLESDCFEISAKIPEGATREQLPAMLQALLIERFKLAARKENRPRPGFALMVDKDGPKLKESGSNFMRGREGMLYVGAGPGYSALKGSMSMASFARALSVRLNVPVQDLTGLQGKYDIDVSWVPDLSFEPARGHAAQAAPDPDAEDHLRRLPNPPTADVFFAVRDSLGLRLERRKQQVEVLVIDHIERVPTEN